MGWPQTMNVLDAATLDKLIAQSRLHTGLLLGLALCALMALVESRSVFGLQRRAVGLNPHAAHFAGIPATRVLLWTAVGSGGLAGLAGAVEVMGLRGYVAGDLSPGYGYAGVIVAMLAQLHPLGVPAAAMLVASVFVGADAMSRAFNVPSFIADVMHDGRVLFPQLPGAAMNEAIDLFFTASLWAAVFRIATPLIFGMLGELICERAGVVNLGIEGIMTFGALSAWLAVFHGCDLWTGMLVAAVSGAAFGLLHALLTVPMAQSQHVTGLGITLLAT
eukprot:gene54087-72284_t